MCWGAQHFESDPCSWSPPWAPKCAWSTPNSSTQPCWQPPYHCSHWVCSTITRPNGPNQQTDNSFQQSMTNWPHSLCPDDTTNTSLMVWPYLVPSDVTWAALGIIRYIIVMGHHHMEHKCSRLVGLPELAFHASWIQGMQEKYCLINACCQSGPLSPNYLKQGKTSY